MLISLLARVAAAAATAAETEGPADVPTPSAAGPASKRHAPGGANCVAPRTEADLLAALGGAELAWDEPAPRFQAAAAGVASVVPCLYAPVTVPTAARLHAFQGLAALADGDQERACEELAAAQWLAPKAETPPWILTASALRGKCEPRPKPRDAHVAPPKRGAGLYFDGRRSVYRPHDTPTLFQLSSLDGTSMAVLLSPDDETPEYPVRPPLLRVALGVGAGVAAAGAVAAMIGDLTLQETWREFPYADDPARNVKLVNGLGVTTIGLTAAAAGLGIGAVVEATW